MKPLPFKIPKNTKSAIHIEYDRLSHFYGAYHLHKELQLMLILKGNGLAYIGDQIQDFQEGDIYLLGQNLPHVFKNTNTDGIESISIFFLPDFLGPIFLSLEEAKPLIRLFELSKLGIKPEKNKDKITREIRGISETKGLEQIAKFLSVLNLLANPTPISHIVSQGYQGPKRTEDGQRMNQVFDYIIDHYHENIQLKDIADVANLSPTAFCRYFKQRTRKTFSRYLNEIRIGQACKLLTEKNSSISRICYTTGFQNLSNFNRQFKKITGLTPRAYKIMKS
jgi:AraC-like DNA-binding protein